jgi:thiamine biosynthesis lipoprotein
MTTPCELILYHHSKALADNSAKAILKEAKRLEKKYNYFSKDSLLFAINTRKTNILDSESKNLILEAIKYYKKTEKTFDITIATIKDLYQNCNSLDKLHEEKNKLINYVGCEHIQIKKNKIIFDNPFTKIDLGGFVKEYAVDKAVRILKRDKISSGIVNFGGDIYVLGKKPNGKKFKIGIKNPINPNEFATFVEIENEALATSASYERNQQIEDAIFSHIISKNNIQTKNKSVSVIAKNCIESGVYSTALMINPMLKTNNIVLAL